jgi:hypothetical protein
MSQPDTTALPIGPAMQDGALMPWKIVALAKQKGEFRVSWQYRNDRLRRRCFKLKKQGWLKQVRCPAGEDIFVPGLLCQEDATRNGAA